MPAKDRGTLSTKIPADELRQALHQAAIYQKNFKKRVMTSEILLYTFIKLPDTAAHRILRQLSNQRGFNWASFEDNVYRAAQNRMAADVNFDFKTDANERVALSDDILFMIDEGYTLAKSRNETKCGTEHLLVFLPELRVSASSLVSRLGITSTAVMDHLGDPTTSIHAAARDHVALARQGEMSPVHFREKLLHKLSSTLSMSSDRHVILVGPDGVGKRSLAYALAQQIANGTGPLGLNGLVEMNEQALLDNAVGTVRTALRMARNGLLFVPDIARFFGGFRSEFPDNACAELQKAFYDEDVVLLGTATQGRYDDRLKNNSIITQNSNTLAVKPTSVEETTAILTTLAPQFEADYELQIDPACLPETARLAGRYITEDPLPGAAVHLLHRACAMRLMSDTAHSSAGRTAPPAPRQLTPEDVMVATSILTGIPVTNMGAEERDRYVHMVDHLKKRIIGQDEAVMVLSRAVRTARVGLKDPKRPIGSFLFLGPTGVGKSELAKALAEFMFGTESALIVMDMSEYMDASSVNRLIGSPPGYVGSEAGGQLTNAVKAQPYSVVLFDEVEKADLKVFDLLLQVMDEGRLTSAQGETVSFSECVVLMTSNIGSQHLADPDLSEVMARELAEQELKSHFRPEFLNRLDDIVLFSYLDREDLRQILDLMLRKETRMLEARQIDIKLTATAKSWLLDQNEHPEWGARPLRRIIQEHIRAPLADFMLRENPQDGVTIRLDVAGEGLNFEVS